MTDAWNDLEERTILPGMHGRFIHSERMTFTMWRMDKGAALPEHHHPHEQVVHVQSGELELYVGGERSILTAGTVLVIPPNVPHRGTALTDVRVMDVFAPVREDYRDGGVNILAAAATKA